MTEAEAKDLVKWMIGLFPTITSEQAKLLRDEIMRYPVDDARRVIREHRFLHEFLDWPQLRSGLNAKFREDAMRKEAERNQQWQIEQHHEFARKVVNEMSDDDLEKLKAKALEQMAPDMKEFYAKRDPRKTVSLAMAIVELAGGVSCPK